LKSFIRLSDPDFRVEESIFVSAIQKPQSIGGQMSKADMQGRVVVVTGSGSGIGRATAQRFASAGTKVVVADIAFANAEKTVAEIRKSGGEALAVQTDVSNAASVEALIAQAVKTYGRLDCAVNNAGITGNRGELHEIPDEDWERVLGVNLRGVFLCLKYEIRQMLKQGGRGAIVNLASVAGIAASSSVSYGASKHGVVGLTRTAAKQYSAQGIRVNAVCPGAVDTPMTADIPREKRLVGPIGRTGQPEELAEAIFWLCTDAASYVVGHALPVDGGWINH
jgi:NAD(P)-dependent dehydrogenase (short-subunit alcohol dehydrogenase family)